MNTSKVPDRLRGIESPAMPELSDYDSACMVLMNLDYNSQLAAICKLLKLHKAAENEHRESIIEAKKNTKTTTGFHNDYAVDNCIDLMHESVYQDAAHSMAAVGMLAPFVESLFYQAFHGIRKAFFDGNGLPSTHDRWQQSSKNMWDCHFALHNGKKKRGLVKGIVQMSEAVGLTDYLPDDLDKTLSALFLYRNKMFHNGYEWPIEERNKFVKRIGEVDWPKDWFQSATHDSKPWIFYFSDVFINHCYKTIEEVINGIGRFCKNRNGNSNL